MPEPGNHSDQKKLGRFVKMLRRRRGMSKDDLAGKSGLTELTVWRTEEGITEPRLSTIMALAKGLDVEPCVLISILRGGCPFRKNSRNRTDKK